VTTPKVRPGHAGIGRVLDRALARVTVIGAVPECGPVLHAVDHTALVNGPMLYGLLPRPVAFLVKADMFRRPLGTLLRRTGQILVAFGEPLGLPAGPAARRTVAAAAGEIHRALAAHVAATRPADATPPAEPERDQP
jgi:hypothetical protein